MHDGINTPYASKSKLNIKSPMQGNPVTFNLSSHTIRMIGEYCSEHNMIQSKFVRDTLDEYLNEIEKLANAVANRILAWNSHAPCDDIKRVAHRIQGDSCKKLREIARKSDLTFDGLTRIIFDDKLRKLNQG